MAQNCPKCFRSTEPAPLGPDQFICMLGYNQRMSKRVCPKCKYEVMRTVVVERVADRRVANIHGHAARRHGPGNDRRVRPR